MTAQAEAGAPPGVRARPRGAPTRGRDGYAPIREYAALGDGRALALVARDGSIDWLCLPDLDSPSAFGALLDSRRGGRFELAPDMPFESTRRYLPDTNVLETTFTTAKGVVRVTDAMLLPSSGLAPQRELGRRVQGLAGRVPMRWRVEPRLGYGSWPTHVEMRAGVPIARARGDALAVTSWDGGEPVLGEEGFGAGFTASEGSEALFSLASASGEPVVFPARTEVESRFAETTRFWRDWAERRRYDGPWREEVVRSALALKLLIHSPTGAIAAAATTSLPESMGGERNWDYRYSWVRDSAFTLDALLRLGCPGEATSFFWWLNHASQLTHPTLRVLYRLNGGTPQPEADLEFEGYRGSAPVRIGNGAADQEQLDIYGHLLTTAAIFVASGGELDRDTGKRLAETADLVCRRWRETDSGIWEVRGEPVHFTESKMMCAAALDRAIELAEAGAIPARHVARWRREAAAIRQFIDTFCFSRGDGSYVRSAGVGDVDASLLLGVLIGYADASDPRMVATTERVVAELSDGPLVHRYKTADDLPGEEGAFLACSFWLVDALARHGQRERAARLMEASLGLANDVGLFAEELEPESGEFLGNFPQGLVHLALINAAATLEEQRP